MGLGSVNMLSLLLASPLFARTFTGPVVAPAGTAATIWVSVQLIMEVALILLKMTDPLPLADWNPVPLIVTCAPTIPPPGETLVIRGWSTVYVAVILLATPP